METMVDRMNPFIILRGLATIALGVAFTIAFWFAVFAATFPKLLLALGSLVACLAVIVFLWELDE